MRRDCDPALAWLFSLADQERGVGWNPRASADSQWKLGRTRALLDLAGAPDRHLRIALVAGTKGKGSTCAMLASILGAAGVRCGLYTKPHLQAYRERIRVDGQRDLARGAGSPPGHVRARCLRSLPAAAGEPTTFEVTTALAPGLLRPPGLRAGRRRGRPGRAAGRDQRDRARAERHHLDQLRPHGDPGPHAGRDRLGKGRHPARRSRWRCWPSSVRRRCGRCGARVAPSARGAAWLRRSSTTCALAGDASTPERGAGDRGGPGAAARDQTRRRSTAGLARIALAGSLRGRRRRRGAGRRAQRRLGRRARRHAARLRGRSAASTWWSASIVTRTRARCCGPCSSWPNASGRRRPPTIRAPCRPPSSLDCADTSARGPRSSADLATALRQARQTPGAIALVTGSLMLVGQARASLGLAVPETLW